MEFWTQQQKLVYIPLAMPLAVPTTIDQSFLSASGSLLITIYRGNFAKGVHGVHGGKEVGLPREQCRVGNAPS